MKNFNKYGLAIVQVALLILIAGTFCMAQETKNDVTDPVSLYTEQFDFAKQSQQVQSPATPTAANADKLTKEIITHREDKNFLVIILLLLAMIASNISVLYFVRKCSNYCAEDIVHASGLVLIVFGTILVVVIADTDQQMTASIGIMGAVAGYLFGTMTRLKNTRQQ